MAHILLVHDHPAIRFAITGYLEILGHRVTPAARAHLAVEEACPEIDVVVAELDMPGMGAVRLIQTLRERGVFAPAILLSERFPHPQEAAEAASVLLEPFGPDQLGDAIRGVLGVESSDAGIAAS